MFRWLHEHCFGTNGRVLKWTGESPKEFIQEARKLFDLNYGCVNHVVSIPSSLAFSPSPGYL